MKHLISKDNDYFEANTIEEAYKLATLSFDCSILSLDMETIQAPNKGFLGLFAIRV